MKYLDYDFTKNLATYSKVDLPIEQICSQVSISKLALTYSNQPELIIRQAVDQVVMRLVAMVPAQPTKPVSYKYPANWWEHVKERFAPKWFLKRFPVEYEIYSVEAKVFYPQIKLPMQQYVPTFSFVKLEDRNEVNELIHTFCWDCGNLQKGKHCQCVCGSYEVGEMELDALSDAAYQKLP